MGYSTKSCKFRTATTYITMGNVLSYERTDPFSLSFWFKSQDSTDGYLVSKIDSTPTGYHVALRGDASGALEFGLLNNSSTCAVVRTTTTGFNDGVWHHLAATSSGSGDVSGMKIYVDGYLRATSTILDTLSTNTIVNTGNFSVGFSTNSTIGNVDEVVVYNKELSQSEVTAIYNKADTNNISLLSSAANAQSWWRMGDGDTFPNILDQIGSNDGYMTNMIAADIQTDAPYKRIATIERDWRFKANVPLPYSRKCTTFTASSSQYVNLGNVLNFERTDSFSISFWIKFSTSSPQCVFAKIGEADVYPGYQVKINAGTIEFLLFSNNSTGNYIYVKTTGTYNNNAWRHVCVTYNGSSLASGVKIYVDGGIATTTTSMDALSGSILTSVDLYIGGRSTSTDHAYLTASLDEMSVYSGVLSASDVLVLYNRRIPTDLLTMSSPSPSNLLGWWRMGDNDTHPTIVDWSSNGYDGTMVNMSASNFVSDWPTSNSYEYDHANLLVNIKKALTISTGWTDSTGEGNKTLSTPWIVVASSNGTVANTSDNWNSAYDIKFASAGVAHSWIVLRAPNLIDGYNYEICLDTNNGTTYFLSTIISFGAGFDVSSPSILNRPTATDQLIWGSSETWFNDYFEFSTILNTCVSDDGYSTRLWGVVAGGTNRCFWIFERPSNVVPQWTNPCIGAFFGKEGCAYSQLNDNSWLALNINGTNGWAYLSTEFYYDGCLGQRQTTVNGVTGAYPATAMGISCITPGIQGYHGQLSDIWYGSTTPGTGDTYSYGTTLKQFVNVGDCILPWNCSTPVLT